MTRRFSLYCRLGLAGLVVAAVAGTFISTHERVRILGAAARVGSGPITTDASITSKSTSAGPASAVVARATAATLVQGAIAPMPVISRGVPAYATSKNLDWNCPATPPAGVVGTNGAWCADDDDYGTVYRGAAPASVIYNLAGVPPAHRGSVVAVYYNGSYGYSTIYGAHYNNAASYTIDVNPAPSAGTPPASGWTTLVSVTGNTLHSRQHAINLAGYNWVRFYASASDGSSQNMDIAFNFDIQDASQGITDDWIFYGDSITAGGCVDCFATQINASMPLYFPVAENGGDPFQVSQDAVNRILGSTGYLSLFPGKYVALNFGMNDAAGTDDVSYYRNMKQVVQAVLAAGKVPIIPTINYTNEANHNANIPAFNLRIYQLYAEFPQIIRGPDFWTFFRSNSNLIKAGDIHPNDAGYTAMRQQWASVMLSEVYAGTSQPTTASRGARLMSWASSDSAPLVTPAPRPSPTPVPTPRVIYSIYTGTLTPGWVNWSWSSAVDLAVSTPVYSGTHSIGWTPDAWGGLKLHSLAAVDTTGSTTLHFALYASLPGQEFTVELRDPDGASLGSAALTDQGGESRPNRWKVYDIALGDLHATGKQVADFVVIEATGTPQATVYLDEISLTSNSRTPASNSKPPDGLSPVAEGLPRTPAVGANIAAGPSSSGPDHVVMTRGNNGG